jgi:hypothetical protein
VFEDWSEDVPATYDAPPWPGMADATARELDLMRELWTCTEPGTDVAHVRHKILADRIGLKSDRQVRTLMARLYARCWVLPIPRMVPNLDGGWRRGANYYRLLVPLHALPTPTARKLQSKPSSQVAPLGSGRRLPNKNVGTRVSLEEEGASRATRGETVSNPSDGRLFELDHESSWWRRA